MSAELTIILQRINRIESMLAKVLHEGPVKQSKRMLEKDVIKQYGVGRSRLQQMRQGYNRKGKFYPPVLIRWGHRGGKHIDYDVEELEKFFKKQIIVND